MKAVLILLSSALQTFAAPQTLDVLNQIFTSTDGSEISTATVSSDDCVCVPYYLCRNKTIINDGLGIIDIRSDNDPCDAYSVCCYPPDRVEQPIIPPPQIDKPKGGKGCGVRNRETFNFDINKDEGNLTKFGEFPWMVAVLREEAVEGNTRNTLFYECGGSLIHPQAVLTSAHCVSGKDKKYQIRAAEWDIQSENELYGHEDRSVRTIILHPEYYARKLFNDVAVLILDSPIHIQEYIDTICLPKQGFVIENTRCYVTGWGKNSFGQKGQYEDTLKKVDLPIVSRDTCQEQLRWTRLGKQFELHSSFICAGGEAGKDTCKGYGGSPLVCPIANQPDKYYQAGIVAWGVGCGEKQVPGVYASVAQFRKWIDEQLNAHELDKSFYTY